MYPEDFCDGPGVKNSAEDTSSIPSPRRFHILQSN